MFGKNKETRDAVATLEENVRQLRQTVQRNAYHPRWSITKVGVNEWEWTCEDHGTDSYYTRRTVAKSYAEARKGVVERIALRDLFISPTAPKPVVKNGNN